MRCLVVADLHYSLPQFDWVLNVAGDFDLVIIAGDHLDLSSLVEGRAQTVVIRKYIELMREKTKVVDLLRQPRPRFAGSVRRKSGKMAH